MNRDIDPPQEQPSDEWALRPAQLKKGDVILSTTGTFVSWVIRNVIWSDFSHAALYLGGGFVIEAVGDGVRRIHVRALRTHKRVSVFRPRRIPDSTLDKITLVARKLLYRPYSTGGAIATQVRIIRQKVDPDGRFCSQLVAEAFAAGEVFLAGDRPSADLTPKDICQSKILDEVTDQTVERLPTISVARAVEALKPSMRVGGLNARRAQIQFVENELLKVAALEMEKYTCFREPYHFFDVLSQVFAQFHQHPDAARAVDQVLSQELHLRGVTKGEVQFRPSCPGIVSDLLSFNLCPVVSTGETEADLTTFTNLVNDLCNSETWDRTDWKETLSELECAAKQTDLESLKITHDWLITDYSVVDANYGMLSDLQRAKVIQFK